ncbi:MAG TPA: hypothetical protein EYG86_08870 [Crocinitomicaceae bacterium]|nr:hypothetical protein [Crocinitomicaceae bacterium]
MELKSYKEQINEVQNLVDKMEQGILSASELTDLEIITRSLHERSIILKYKAFEQIAQHEVEESIVESVEEEEVEEEKEASPFDWNPTAEEEVKNPELEKLEEIIEEEIEEVIKEEVPVIELTEEEMKVETPPSIQDILGEISENKEVLQEIVEENVEMPEEAPVNSSSTENFVAQLKLSDSSTHSFSLGTKLDTLIGAFGLNEKLRFINDLFDGSSESFNDAVKLLDTQNDLNEAYSHVNRFASEQNWESDDETVSEFVSFVNRRYA